MQSTGCPGCGAPIVSGVNRCSGCGIRAPRSPGESTEVQFESAVPENGLTELEVEILIESGKASASRIHSYRDETHAESEIKAGKARMDGDDAVAALNHLVELELVEAADDDGYVLTLDGERAARLHWHRRD